MTEKLIKYLKSSISRKFIIYIFLFSSIITLFLTALQLYLDYRFYITEIERGMNQIENSYLPGIKETMWIYDQELLDAQLGGIMQLPDMQFVEIKKQNQQIAFHGSIKSTNIISREFQLYYRYREKDIELGTMVVAVNLENIYQRLIDKTLVILIGQTFKTFLVSSFIFFLFFQLIGKYINQIVGYLFNLNLDELNQQPLNIGRFKHTPDLDETDELGQLERSINDMRERLYSEILHSKKVSEKLTDSEKLFRTIFEQAAVGVALIESKTGRFLRINRRYCEIVGYTVEEMSGGKTFQEISYLDDLHTDFNNMDRLLAGDIHEFTMEKRYFHKNGSIVWVNLTVSPTWQFGEEPNRHIAIVEDITERKQAQEEKDRILILSQDLICVAGMDGYFKYVSPACENILGYKQDEMLQKPFLEFIHPDDHAKTNQEVENLRAGKKTIDFENRYICKDGTIRLIQWAATPFVQENLIYCTGRDITDAKKSQDKFNAMLDHSPAVIYFLNEQNRMLYINRAWEKIFNTTKKDVIGKTIYELFPKEAADQFCKANRRVFQTGNPIELEEAVPQADGTHQYISIKFLIKDNYYGNNLLCGISTDITKRKQAEAALLESEEQFRHFFEHLTIGVAVYEAVEDGEDFVFVDMNSAGQQLSRVSIDEIRGKRLTRIFPEMRNLELLRALQRTWLTGQPNHVPFSEYKDARITQWVENWVFRLPSGKIAAVYEDRTEFVRLEERMRQNQKMEAIGNLAAGIAHDFNNLLFPIIGMSEMLLDDLQKGTQEYENTESILLSGIRGSELVKQILAFSCQSEHKMMPTHIQNIIKEVIKLSRSAISSYIEIHYDVQQDCGMILADPIQMHQICMNLITNAKHAVENTGGIISVKLRQMILEAPESIEINISPGAYAVLSVSDTGHGMSDKLLNQIFDPYFTTKEQGKGTGLGLSVVYGIVKEHNGCIKVLSEIGKGSTFNIYLPLMKKLNGAESISEAEEYQGGKERILLVDDEEPVINLEKQMLERMGYKVTSRQNSIEALEAFKDGPFSFDLVITDMSMPSMTGEQLATELRSIRSDIPIIICTGFSEIMNAEKAKESGIKGFLMKPVIKSKMAQTVRNVLGEAKGSEQQ